MRLRRSISIVVAASLAGLACAQTQISVESPLQYKNARILVNVSVNQHPAIFLLDTGAVDTYIDTRMLNEHLEQDGTTIVLSPIGRKVQPVLLAQISFGARTFRMHVVGIDLSQLRKECDCNAAGILGMSALQAFSKFEVDFRKKLFIIRQ